MLGGSLNLNERTRTSLDNVHIRLRAHIFNVGKIEHGSAIDNANGNCAHRIRENLLRRRSRDDPLRNTPRNGLVKRNIRARNGSGAGAAISSQNIAVKDQRVLSEGLDINDRAKRAADET